MSARDRDLSERAGKFALRWVRLRCSERPPLNLLDIYRFSHSTVILHQSRTESWESWGMLRSIPCSSILFSLFFLNHVHSGVQACGPDRSPSIYNNKSCATVPPPLHYYIYVSAQSDYVSSSCIHVWFNTDVIHIRRWRLNGGQEPPSRQTKCLGN